MLYHWSLSVQSFLVWETYTRSCRIELYTCMHTYMDCSGFVFIRSIFLHQMETKMLSSLLERFAFNLLKTIDVPFAPFSLWTHCSIITQHTRCFLLFLLPPFFTPAVTTYFHSRCLWWHSHTDKQQIVTHWIFKVLMPLFAITADTLVTINKCSEIVFDGEHIPQSPRIC